MQHLTKPHRLYGVTIHDKTTKSVVVPKYEIGILKAIWRGTELNVQETAETREVMADARLVYNDLLNRYDNRAVASFFPGPERLEIDLEASAAETARWLAEVRRLEQIEENRRTAADKQSGKRGA